MKKLPVIGITMGDPSGIGPEIISKLYINEKIHEICRPVVIGDPGVMEAHAGKSLKITEIYNCEDISGNPDNIEIITVSKLDKKSYRPGNPSIEGGTAMVEAVKKAVELAQKEEISAMVTCPINKALMNSAGYNFEGHTQLIASLTNSEEYVMMLAGSWLRVTLVTIHCSLRDVPSKITENNIYKTIMVTARSLQKDFDIKKPRIAVAALNPHAGEDGLFGKEETEKISPAIKRAAAHGYRVTGPFPADALYPRAVDGGYDAIVNMYHDQGLIPLKLLHFSDSVNITLGLPIIRTSVDHGTAYDIAGKGLANHKSLKAAVVMASEIVDKRSEFLT